MKAPRKLKEKLGFLGVILISIGGLSDRILYHLIYLNSIGKSFTWVGSLDDILGYYYNAYSWIPLIFIAVGLLLVYLPIRGG